MRDAGDSFSRIQPDLAKVGRCMRWIGEGCRRIPEVVTIRGGVLLFFEVGTVSRCGDENRVSCQNPEGKKKKKQRRAVKEEVLRGRTWTGTSGPFSLLSIIVSFAYRTSA